MLIQIKVLESLSIQSVRRLMSIMPTGAGGDIEL